jgi:hypothetical protein
MKKVIVLVLFIIVGSYGIGSAQQDKVLKGEKTGWHKIGEATINFLTEQYEILVLKADKFGYIKFKVMNAPIVLLNLEVHFESGNKQNIDVASLRKEPGESWVIKLNMGVRTIKKVVFVYKTLPNHYDEKAQVELWGYKQISI